MKLLVRDYLGSLKEREELDAILPDLLSELGFTIFSRPNRGTIQHGVDFAAVGQDEDGVRKLFLFSVKQGDLTRQDWDGSPQSLRPSLNEIKDVYIKTRVPTRHQHLPIVICLCFGGDVQEQVRTAVTGYIKDNTTDRISFDEWNGDKIAELILKGVLREELLPKALRSSFQKSVAMVDEPDVAYDHFSQLILRLRNTAHVDKRSRVRAARQMYICLWILYVWARDIDNLEAPYRSSELALLNVWDVLRPLIGKKNKEAKSLTAVLNGLIGLHIQIAGEFLEKKIFPHVSKRHALSMAVETRSSVDVNLKLFDLLGRIAMSGLWVTWIFQRAGAGVDSKAHEKISEWVNNGLRLIQNNPILFSPLCDEQAIDICLFLLLIAANDGNYRAMGDWLDGMAKRIWFNVRTHGKYPCIYTEYRDLVDHPRERTDIYRKEATAGSTLIPLLASWLTALTKKEALSKLVELAQSELEHCTFQIWLPDSSSEEKYFGGDRSHGVTLSDVPLEEGLLSVIKDACQKEKAFSTLSPNMTGYWPIVLLASRHYRIPVPPQFWIESLVSKEGTPA